MSVAVCPEHIVAELTVVTGEEFTVTFATAVLEHPLVVPVTVYEEVPAGETSAVVSPVDVAPALHVYEVAPPAVKVVVCPEQMVGELTVTIGMVFTVTVDAAVEEHPIVVPVTV